MLGWSSVPIAQCLRFRVRTVQFYKALLFFPSHSFRNRDFQEVTLERDGETLLQFAAVYGFRNIQTLVHRMKKGRVPYQLVEVLSCPGGNATTTPHSIIDLSRFAVFK